MRHSHRKQTLILLLISMVIVFYGLLCLGLLRRLFPSLSLMVTHAVEVPIFPRHWLVDEELILADGCPRMW